MSINITSPWTSIPVAMTYFGLGAAASGTIFNKLSHLAEYTLNKSFGNYRNLRRTLDNRIIVSMPRYNDYYYAQNIVLSALVAVISSQAVRILVLAGCPSVIAVPLLVGSVAAPLLFGIFNMVVRNTGGHHGRFVELSNAEIQRREINVNNVAQLHSGERVYCDFGSAPQYFPGTNSHD